MTLGSSCFLLLLAFRADAFTAVPKATAFRSKTSLAALPDFLELPSPKVAETIPDVVETVSDAAPSVDAEAVGQVVDTVSPQVDAVSSQLPDLPVAGIAAVALAGAAAFFVSSKKKKPSGEAPVASAQEKAAAEVIAEESSEPADVPSEPEAAADDMSIPYDAAAMLAFEDSDETDFEKFKVKYEEKAVADVIAKKKARESS